MRYIESKETLPAVISEEKCTDLIVVEEKPVELKFICSIPPKVSGVKKPVELEEKGTRINIYA